MDEVEESEQETPECLPKQEETPVIVNHTEIPHKPVKKESLRERMNVFREQTVKGGRADEEKTGEIEETL